MARPLFGRFVVATLVLLAIEASDAGAQSGPLRAYTWEKNPDPDASAPNLLPMIEVKHRLEPYNLDDHPECAGCERRYLHRDADGGVSFSAECQTCAELAGEQAADLSHQLSDAGGVVLRLPDPAPFASHPADAPHETPPEKIAKWRNTWFTVAQAQETARFHDFLQGYTNANGRPITHVALDIEDDASSWRIEGAGEWDNYRAIWEDERAAPFQALLPPEENWEAFAFWWQNEQTRANVVEWNAMSGLLQCNAMNAAYTETAKDFFPTVRVSQHGSSVMSKANASKVVAVSLLPEYGDALMGTDLAPAFYGIVLNAGSYYGSTPFDILQYEIDRLRQMRCSSPQVPFSPWIATTFGPYPNTPYQRELVFHLALSGASDFLLFNYPLDGAQEKKIDEYLAAINARFGECSRQAKSECEPAWANSTLITGMKIGSDTWHWRITVPPNVTRVVMTPGDVIVQIPPGEAGAWYTTASGSTPTATPIADVSICQ